MCSSAAKNFFCERPVSDVITSVTDVFLTVKIDTKHQQIFYQVCFRAAWPRWPHSGFATGDVSPVQAHSQVLGFGGQITFLGGMIFVFISF